MSDHLSNLGLPWQYVSEFVSWEFCRYVGEQTKRPELETDVLAYLRDMMVQRTKKAFAEISKHEIVAQFIMDIKEVHILVQKIVKEGPTEEIQYDSRMSRIEQLSEAVKKIIPELESAVSALVLHLETFLNRLQTTEMENRREILQGRIEGSINNFIKEANRLLPQPHLLQVIDFWKSHNDSFRQPVKKVIYNKMLCHKVLEYLSLYDEITKSEAGEISKSLNADEIFLKILQEAKDDPEVVAKSLESMLQAHFNITFKKYS